MNSTNNNSFEIAAKKVFSDLYDLIKEDEKLNNNHVLLQELPNDVMQKINNNLLDKNDKRFNKIFSENKDDKLLEILFNGNIPDLKFIDPDIFNKFKTNINLDCIKKYINKNEKFNKIKCHSFQTVFKVNKNINLTSFHIRILDENNNKIGSISSSCKVSFKFKDKDKEEFLCSRACQKVINDINNEIKNYIINYKYKQDVEPESYKEYIEFNTLTKQKQYTFQTFNFTEINKVDLSLFFKKIKEHYKELNIENFKIEIRSKENYKIYSKSRFEIFFYNEQNIKCLSFNEENIKIYNFKKKYGITNDYYNSIFEDGIFAADAKIENINQLKDVCSKDEHEQIINKLADLEEYVKTFHQIFE